ncbi:MAG: (deoxy)nucleoside triphosphate pyrophosphohydrolase [Marmoricola sp.]
MTLVVGVALGRGGRVLAARRADDGRWELPGGKVEPGEDPAAAAVREIEEELGCAITVTGWLEGSVPIREGLELRVATAALVAGEPVPRAGEHQAVRWLRPGELAGLDWAPADLPFVAELTDRGVGAGH